MDAAFGGCFCHGKTGLVRERRRLGLCLPNANTPPHDAVGGVLDWASLMGASLHDCDCVPRVPRVESLSRLCRGGDRWLGGMGAVVAELADDWRRTWSPGPPSVIALGCVLIGGAGGGTRAVWRQEVSPAPPLPTPRRSEGRIGVDFCIASGTLWWAFEPDDSVSSSKYPLNSCVGGRNSLPWRKRVAPAEGTPLYPPAQEVAPEGDAEPLLGSASAWNAPACSAEWCVLPAPLRVEAAAEEREREREAAAAAMASREGAVLGVEVWEYSRALLETLVAMLAPPLPPETAACPGKEAP